MNEPPPKRKLFEERLRLDRQNAEFNLSMARNTTVEPSVRYHYYVLLKLHLSRHKDYEFFGLTPETFEELSRDIDFVPNLVRKGHAWQPTSEIYSELLCDPNTNAFRAYRTLQRLIAAHRPLQ